MLAAVLGWSCPVRLLSQRHDRRRAAVQDALVDAIAHLRDGIRTGLSVQEALVGVARSGPEALRAEFTTLARESAPDRLRAGAAGHARATGRSGVRRRGAATLVLNDRLGGRNVSQVLDRLADATRAQQRIQEELRAYQAATCCRRASSRCVPLVVLIAIRSVNPALPVACSTTVSGQLILAGCAAQRGRRLRRHAVDDAAAGARRVLVRLMRASIHCGARPRAC